MARGNQRQNTLIGRPRVRRPRRPGPRLRIPGRGIGFGGGFGFGGGLGGGLFGGGLLNSITSAFKTTAPKPPKPKHQPRTKIARAHKKNALIGAGTHPKAKGPAKGKAVKPLKNPFRRSTGYNVK